MFHGLVVRALAWGSRDPGSNLGGSKCFFSLFFIKTHLAINDAHIIHRSLDIKVVDTHGVLCF